MKSEYSFYLLIGTVIGAICTAFFGLMRDNIMFNKQAKKEEKILRERRREEENNITKRLVARLFGTHNELIGSYYLFIENYFSHCCYVRLAEVETEKSNKEFFNNLALTSEVRHNESKEKIFKILREYSEILGEYAYLNPKTKVADSYNLLIKSQPNLVADFSKVNTFKEAEALRFELIKKYNAILANETEPKGLAVVHCMEIESKEKFKEFFT